MAGSRVSLFRPLPPLFELEGNFARPREFFMSAPTVPIISPIDFLIATRVSLIEGALNKARCIPAAGCAIWLADRLVTDKLSRTKKPS